MTEGIFFSDRFLIASIFQKIFTIYGIKIGVAILQRKRYEVTLIKIFINLYPHRQ